MRRRRPAADPQGLQPDVKSFTKAQKQRAAARTKSCPGSSGHPHLIPTKPLTRRACRSDAPRPAIGADSLRTGNLSGNLIFSARSDLPSLIYLATSVDHGEAPVAEQETMRIGRHSA
jgi:hypothetical protein